MALKGALFPYDAEIVLALCEEHGELKTDLSLKCWLILYHDFQHGGQSQRSFLVEVDTWFQRVVEQVFHHGEIWIAKNRGYTMLCYSAMISWLATNDWVDLRGIYS